MSRSLHAGLTVFGVLSAADLALPLLTDGEHPPMPVALLVAALGLASLALVVLAWRDTRPRARRAVSALVVLRLLSAATAVPAFFAAGAPAAALTSAAAVVALTLTGTALVLAPARAVTR